MYGSILSTGALMQACEQSLVLVSGVLARLLVTTREDEHPVFQTRGLFLGLPRHSLQLEKRVTRNLLLRASLGNLIAKLLRALPFFLCGTAPRMNPQSQLSLALVKGSEGSIQIPDLGREGIELSDNPRALILMRGNFLLRCRPFCPRRSARRRSTP